MTTFPAPKPAKRPAARRAWNSSCPAPTKAVRHRNAKKHDANWTRAYHSEARVRFVKTLPCVVCLAFGGIDNAHTKGDGASRKGHYTTIVPMTGKCHRAWHRRGDDFLREWNLTREDLELEAEFTEKRWKRSQGQVGA